jgi:hypothetical protein
MYDELTIRAHAAPWNDGVEFLARLLDSVGKPITFETQIDKSMRVEPTFHLSMDKAQLLMDDLWMAGLRPTEGTGSAGALKATERHLQDLQRLVFEMLGRGLSQGQPQHQNRHHNPP